MVVMTVQEAFETLGLARTASADTAKRAYLVKVRGHKPERDPEGFKRVREAYELVQRNLVTEWWHAEEDQNEDEVEVEDEDEDEDEVEVEDEDEVEVEVEVEVEDEDEDEGESETKNEPENENEPEPIPAPAFAPVRPPPFALALPPIVLRYQPLVDAPVVGPFYRGATPSAYFRMARALHASDFTLPAAEVLTEGLQLATSRLESGVQPAMICDILLALHAKADVAGATAHPAAATALLAATKAWTELHGREFRVFAGALAVRYGLAKELTYLSLRVLPPTPRAIMAAAIRDGKLADARAPLTDWAFTHSPDAKFLADYLEALPASQLCALYLFSIKTPAHAPKPPPRQPRPTPDPDLDPNPTRMASAPLFTPFSPLDSRAHRLVAIGRVILAVVALFLVFFYFAIQVLRVTSTYPTPSTYYPPVPTSPPFVRTAPMPNPLKPLDPGRSR